MKENYKSLRKTIGWSTAIILGIILLLASAIICTNSDSNEENRRAYERGYNWPSAVGRDLVFIDVGARIKCNRMGLDQDACPQSDGDTTRRVMATLMTQTIEKNGPAWEGYAYVPETIRAMNHRFVDLIRHLEENPCSLIPYGYANDQILEQLRKGRFIYRCGQGWSITAEWLEDLDKPELLSPNTPGEHDPTVTPVEQGLVIIFDEALETPNFESASQVQEAAEQSPCDQLLRNQLAFQIGASNPGGIQEVVQQIQAQRGDCVLEIWDPVVNDNNRTGANGCWESETATERMNNPKVGNMEVPDGLFDTQDSAISVMRRSGRDRDNNVIVYWWNTIGRGPSDGAACWLYVSSLNSWSKD